MAFTDPAVAAAVAEIAAAGRRALVIECRVLNRARATVPPQPALEASRRPPAGGGQPLPAFLFEAQA